VTPPILLVTMQESVLFLVLAVLIFGKTASGCSCTDETQVDHTGKTIGRCLTSFGGNPWCYVVSTSSCPDKKQSSRNNQLYWSAQACQDEGGQEGDVQAITAVSGYGTDKLPTCTTTEGTSCAFPFKFNGKGYRGCTLDSAKDGVAWCSTKVDGSGNHVKGNFGNCPSECPTDPGYFIASQDFGAHGGSNSSSQGARDAAIIDIVKDQGDFGEITAVDPYDSYPCRMYQHCSYGGRILLIPGGASTHTVRPWNFNDIASSFKVKSGYKLEVWEHNDYRGRYGWIAGHANVNCVEGSWNDAISSIRCVRNGLGRK